MSFSSIASVFNMIYMWSSHSLNEQCQRSSRSSDTVGSHSWVMVCCVHFMEPDIQDFTNIKIYYRAWRPGISCSDQSIYQLINQKKSSCQFFILLRFIIHHLWSLQCQTLAGSKDLLFLGYLGWKWEVSGLQTLKVWYWTRGNVMIIFKPKLMNFQLVATSLTSIHNKHSQWETT